MRSETVVSDLTIVGGGLAGVCAAVAAARLGASVALINNRPVLGGNSSSEIRVPVHGAAAHVAQKYARESGIMGELWLENQWRNSQGNPYYWDQVVLDAVRAEPNIALFLNADVREVELEESPLPDGRTRLASVTGWQMGSERDLRFESPLFIDSSGDGLVGHLAGAEYRTGRESRDEFGEEWAPENPDDNLLGSTLLFYVKDTGRPEPFVPPRITKDLRDTGILSKDWDPPIHPTTSGCEYWWIEWGGQLDIVDENEPIRDELWGVVFGIWDHIKNSGRFDADTLTLEWVGCIPGKREYRRFVGDHMLIQSDIVEQRVFDDVVGFGGWSIDLHPADGMYAKEAPCKHLFPSGLYHLPFRSLYSRNVANLLMAGRDISASHVAFGSTRVMATCAVTGEAAGTGAVLALALGIDPRGVAHSHATELRRLLLRQDASLLGVASDDPDDLIREAQMSADSVLDQVATDPGADEIDLREQDVAILLPIDAGVSELELMIDADHDGVLDAEWWSPGRGQNSIPVEFLKSSSAAHESGRGWVRIAVPQRDADGALVLVLPRAGGIRLPVSDAPAPYGVLVMLRREPRSVAEGGPPPTNAWSAAEHRGRSVGLRFAVPRAYAADRARGGYARPFDGPQLWSAVSSSGTLTAEWDGPRDLARVELVFNDDPDATLMNLRLPRFHGPDIRVIPDLVRDYRLDARIDGEWRDLVTITDNRMRHRAHSFAPVNAEGLRLVVSATNGSSRATVFALRAYTDPDPRLLHSEPPRLTTRRASPGSVS